MSHTRLYIRFSCCEIGLYAWQAYRPISQHENLVYNRGVSNFYIHTYIHAYIHNFIYKGGSKKATLKADVDPSNKRAKEMKICNA